MSDVLISPQGRSGSWSADGESMLWTGSGSESGKYFGASSNKTSNLHCYPGKAFDNITSYADGTIWQIPNTETTADLIVDLYENITLHKYQTWNTSSFYNTAWTILGSTDNSNWYTVDSRSGETAQDGTWYTCSSPGNYRYYIFRVTGTGGGGGGHITLCELKLYTTVEDIVHSLFSFMG